MFLNANFYSIIFNWKHSTDAHCQLGTVEHIFEHNWTWVVLMLYMMTLPTNPPELLKLEGKRWGKSRASLNLVQSLLLGHYMGGAQ